MFEIIKHKIDENLIISMEGDIDNDNHDNELFEVLRREVGMWRKNIIINFSKIYYLNSSGIKNIIMLFKALDNNKLTLKYDSRVTWQDTTFGSFRHIFPAIKTEELC